MFEYTIDKSKDAKKLTEAQAKQVADDVASKFSDFDEKRAKQKDIYAKLKPEIFVDTDRKPDGGLLGGEKYYVFLNTTSSLYDTEQAFLWDNTFSKFSQMYDVEGMDEASEKNAKTQKQALDDSFYKMKVEKQLDIATGYFSSVGEMCLFVSWKKKVRQIRRRLTFMERLVKEGVAGLLRGGGAYGVFEVPVYEGAYVNAINPLNLVFDPSINPDIPLEWDSCAKIVKHWETYHAISSNKEYKLTKDQLEKIKTSISQDDSVEDAEDKDDSELLDDVINGNKIEVLEYWGDYLLDGEVLTNWRIVVIGREFLAAFGYNHWVINPIINCATKRDADSKRGIPDLYSVYNLCKDEEFKVYLENKSQALAFNPPRYAPYGSFSDKTDNDNPKYVSAEEGKVIYYKKSAFDPMSIIPMNFPLINNDRAISFLENKISSVSGIYPNMQGQQDDDSKTATEIKVRVAGQTTRLSKKIDTIKQNAIIPIVGKVAELNANMKSKDESIFIKESVGDAGLVETVKHTKTINDEIRQGNYDYKYTDSNGIQKRLQENRALMGIFTPIWNDPSLQVDKKEVITTALENEGFEDPSKFFVNNKQIMPQIPTNPMARVSPQPAEVPTDAQPMAGLGGING